MKNLFNLFNLFVCLSLLASCTSNNKIVDNSTERKYNVALANLQAGNSIEKNSNDLKIALAKMIATNQVMKDSLQQENSLENKAIIHDIDVYLIDKISPATPFLNGLYDGKMDSLKTEEQALKTELANNLLGTRKTKFAYCYQ